MNIEKGCTKVQNKKKPNIFKEETLYHCGTIVYLKELRVSLKNQKITNLKLFLNIREECGNEDTDLELT